MWKRKTPNNRAFVMKDISPGVMHKSFCRTSGETVSRALDFEHSLKMSKYFP